MAEKEIALTRWEGNKDHAKAAETEAQGVLEELDDLVIETQDDLEFAAEILADVKGNVRQLKDMQDRVVLPINTALKELRSWFKPALRALEKCESGLKSKIAKAHAEVHARQQEALQVAATASMQGDTEAASAAMEQASETDFEPVKGLSMRHTWDYDIIDFDKVPREYMLVDDSKVKAVIRAHKGDITIPGIQVKRNTSVASSAS